MKKKIIKEIVFLTLTLIISSLVTIGFGLYEKLRNEKIENNLTSLHATKTKKDSLLANAPPFALLYFELKNKNIYKKDFDDFNIDFGNLSFENPNDSKEKISFLYNLTKNNSIQHESLEDFGNEYYPKHNVIEILMSIESFGLKDRTSYIKHLNENPEAVKQMYRESVLEGYKHSFENFEYLLDIREKPNNLDPNEIIKIRQSQKEINSEIDKSEQQKVAYETKFTIGILLLIFFVVFRYSVLLFKWTNNELKK